MELGVMVMLTVGPLAATRESIVGGRKGVQLLTITNCCCIFFAIVNRLCTKSRTIVALALNPELSQDPNVQST